MNTMESLQAAFSGESQANRKYTAFAQQADAEGFPQAAKLFRAAANSETVHALNHLMAMRQVGDTRQNLETAIAGEDYEYVEMYPAFIAQAEADGNEEAAVTFRYANAVEMLHADLFRKALEALDNPPIVDYFVCQACGNTVAGQAPNICSVCGAPKTKFKLIDE